MLTYGGLNKGVKFRDAEMAQLGGSIIEGGAPPAKAMSGAAPGG
jgi:hypothetical protein